MVNVLILADEDHIRESLKELVSTNPLVSKIFDVSSTSEAVSIAEKRSFDIALIYIELEAEEGLDGIYIAKIMQKLNPKTYIVFLLGYPQYTIDSFQVTPDDFILKPFIRERIKEIISTLATKVVMKGENLLKSSYRIRLKMGNEILFLKPNDVIFIERQGKTTLIHTKESIYKIDKLLIELEKVLPANFVRVHRSFIINIDKIKRVKEVSRRSYEIDFYGYTKTAQMSRYKFEEYKDIFSNFQE
ncbi:LytTR family DNA-binding domain-containing protein [Thermovorax subterraneus]|nr:LytTR family DNA-binding domain-containing protein [Thermovorax subterraneus]